MLNKSSLYYVGDRLLVATKLLDARPHEKILDVGCATGYLQNYLIKSRKTEFLVGIDIRLHDLKKARKLVPMAYFILASAPFLPFRNRIFNKVTVLETLQFLKPRQQALFIRELSRIVKKSGLLVLSFPAKSFFVMYLLRYPSVSIQELQRTLNKYFEEKELFRRGLILFLTERMTCKFFDALATPVPRFLLKILLKIRELDFYNNCKHGSVTFMSAQLRKTSNKLTCN